MSAMMSGFDRSSKLTAMGDALCWCSVCGKPFDLSHKRPKIIPGCGHSHCLSCLRVTTRKCPLCQKIYTKPPDNLPDNHKLLEALARRDLQRAQEEEDKRLIIVAQAAEAAEAKCKVTVAEAVVQTEPLPDVVPAQPPTEAKPSPEDVKVQATLLFWCLDCDQKASVACIDDHTVRSLRAVRTTRYEEARGQLEAQSSAEASLSGLQDALEQAVLGVQPELEACRGRLEAEKALLHEARARLETALVGDAAQWEEALKAAPQYALSQEAARFLAALASRGVSCSLVVAAEGADGGAACWKGRVEVGQSALAKLLLCGLVSQGGLRRQEEQEPQERRAQQDQQEREQRAAEEREREAQRQRDEQQLELEELQFAASATTWEERPNTAELSLEERAARVRTGCRVRPGRDWTGERASAGMVGTVEKVRDGYAVVRWDGRQDRSEHSLGRDGKLCLRRLSGLSMHAPGVGKRFLSQPHLYVAEVSGSSDIAEKTRLLATGAFAQLRSLKSLRCDAFPAWAERVLQQAGPRLEALLVQAPAKRHLEAIKAMPQLRRLCFSGAVEDAALPLQLEELYFTAAVTEKQLAQVAEMTRLRRLEVHAARDGPLPALRFPRASGAAGLRWLRSGVHPLATALALVRAHAATLEELELVAASDAPYGCPDLAHELRRCRLQCLKRLVLLREEVGGFCRHEQSACRQQKVALWNALLEAGALPTVLCSLCDDLDQPVVVE